MGDDVIGFYDGLAADYHLVYGDRWSEAIDLQGDALAELIAREAPTARTVLDCACGIGTQALGLAARGLAVRGSDVSPAALARARQEAAARGLTIPVAVADFRDLSALGRDFDVVVCADNALPHMDSDAEVRRALRSMHDALTPGGLLVVSTRDYDRALRERPTVGPPIDVPGPPRRVVVRLQDWDGPDSRRHTVRFLVVTERDGGWTAAEHRVRYRALTAAELTAAARDAGLRDVRRHAAAEVGFHQPVMTARRPA